MERLTRLKTICIVVAAFHFTTVKCASFESASKLPESQSSCCSQEFCVFLFDRLEEQSIRLHNIEDTLLRTLSILSSYKEFSKANTALKSDPLINSLLITISDDNLEESIVRRMQEMPDVLETPIHSTVRREKRQTELGLQPESPKERLVQILKWTKIKKSSDIPVETVGEKVDSSKVVRMASRETQQDAPVPIPTSTEKAMPISTYTLYSKSIANENQVSPAPNLQESFAAQKGNQTELQKFVKDSVSDLQGAVKCALAQLNDANVQEFVGVLFEPQATLNQNKTLTVQFELKNCQRYWTAVWIQIFAQNEMITTSSDVKKTVLQIPKECLKKRGNMFWLILPSNAKACSFPLIELLECKVYAVEITPIYFNLQGRSSSIHFTVPPKLTGNSTDLISLQRISLQNSTHMLGLKWSVLSEECALLLKSINLQIYEDESSTAFQSVTVPTDYLGNGKQNDFSITLSSTELDINWKPLDVCRKYKLEVEPVYFSEIKGKLSSIEIFTPSTEYSSCCDILSSQTGVIRALPKENYNYGYKENYNYNYQIPINIYQQNDYGCTWVIFVEKNSTIWLTFTEFNVQNSGYRVKVYDGPTVTSPLLLDHHGTNPPSPIRSHGNKLSIQLASDTQYGRENYRNSFTAHYITVCNDKSHDEGHAV